MSTRVTEVEEEAHGEEYRKEEVGKEDTDEVRKEDIGEEGGEEDDR